jgi:hypothetical protein
MNNAHLVEVFVLGVAAVGAFAGQAVCGVGCAIGVAAFAPRVVGQAFDDFAGFVGDGGNRPQVVVVHVAQAAGLVAAGGGIACGQVTCAGDLQGKHHAACGQVVFVLGDAVGFDFFFVGQAQAVFTIEVPSSARTGLQGCGGAGAELDLLFGALVLGAVYEGERAVSAGAVGGELALAAGELTGSLLLMKSGSSPMK